MRNFAKGAVQLVGARSAIAARRNSRRRLVIVRRGKLLSQYRNWRQQYTTAHNKKQCPKHQLMVAYSVMVVKKFLTQSALKFVLGGACGVVLGLAGAYGYTSYLNSMPKSPDDCTKQYSFTNQSLDCKYFDAR